MEHTYELSYQSLFNAGRSLCFPCDADGRVLLDKLTERAKQNYLYARVVVGREFSFPTVKRRFEH